MFVDLVLCPTWVATLLTDSNHINFVFMSTINELVYWIRSHSQILSRHPIKYYCCWSYNSTFIIVINFYFCDRKDHTKCEFSVHDVFAVDLLISTGEGKTKEKDTRTTVYKKTENNYSLKMKASRGNTVNNYYHFN